MTEKTNGARRRGTNGHTHPNAELVRVMSQRDYTAARLSNALDALAALCAIIRRECGFLTHEQQLAYRAAQSVLVDNGRVVGGER